MDIFIIVSVLAVVFLVVFATSKRGSRAVRILLVETVVFGLLAVLILARMVMDTTTVEDMMAAVMVAIAAVEMAVVDIDMSILPPNQSPEPTAVGAVHVASRRWLSFFR